MSRVTQVAASAGSPARRSRPRQRLHQGGQQQRRDARHDHDVQDAEDPRDQVNGGGKKQQPPRPRGPGLQPARHTAYSGEPAPRSGTRACSGFPGRPGPGAFRRFCSRTSAPRPNPILHASAAGDPVFLRGLVPLLFGCPAVLRPAVLRPGTGAISASAAHRGRIIGHDRIATAIGGGETPARPSPPRSPSPRSTRSSASAWLRNSRCAGHPAAHTYCCRSAPASSTTRGAGDFTAGTQASTRRRTPWRSRRSLPQNVPLSLREWSCAEHTDSPRQLRRSPDGSIETAFALVTGAGEVGRVASDEDRPLTDTRETLGLGGR